MPERIVVAKPSAPAAQELAGMALIGGLCAAASALPLPATMVVAAHPDDEAVGAGSRLPRLAQALFVHVTDGAPRDGIDAARHGLTPAAYAGRRRKELEAALDRCGIGPQQVLRLGCPDQQAALRMAELATQLAQLFLQQEVEAVLTHSYEGGHPDHDATAFAVHAACALLRVLEHAPPALVEMTSYHLGPEGLRPGEFLADAAADAQLATVVLSPAEAAGKRALFACFATQRDTLQFFPLAVERFRPAPRYDFRRPPHAGPLFYEGHDWGMSGERFRALAAAALDRLGLENPL
jgi:LmbE family N-acetylglucosaminyl deacetylase